MGAGRFWWPQLTRFFSSAHDVYSMLRLLQLIRPKAALAEGEDELLPLARAAAGGDPVASRTLLTVLGPHLLRVVRRVLGGDCAEVEDVAQECAIELLKVLPRFRAESSVKHYACRVALHTTMNARRRLRASKRQASWAADQPLEEIRGSEALPDHRIASREGVRLLRQLCDELPEGQAEALALHCVLGYTVDEAAAIAEIPRETLRSRLRLAKRTLMRCAESHPGLRELLEETG